MKRFRLSINVSNRSHDRAFLQGGTKFNEATNAHRSHFPLSVWPPSHSNIDLGPSPSDSTKIKTIRPELTIFGCSINVFFADAQGWQRNTLMYFKDTPRGTYQSCGKRTSMLPGLNRWWLCIENNRCSLHCSASFRPTRFCHPKKGTTAPLQDSYIVKKCPGIYSQPCTPSSQAGDFHDQYLWTLCRLCEALGFQ